MDAHTQITFIMLQLGSEISLFMVSCEIQK